MRNAKVLVTGINGFMGTHIGRWLLQEKATVTGIGRSSCCSLEGIHYIKCDLTNQAEVMSLSDCKEFEYIIHLAGDNRVDSCWSSLLPGNLLSLTNLLSHICGSSLRKVLVLGSAHEYQMNATGLAITEKHLTLPQTAYGWSKHLQVQTALWFSRVYSLPAVIARPFNITGTGNHGVIGQWVKQVVEMEQGSREAVLRVGNCHIFRDFLDIYDAVRAFMGLMVSDLPIGEIYNVCRGDTISLRKILDWIQAEARISFETVMDSKLIREEEPAVIAGCNQKLRSAIDWCPKRSISASISTIFADLRGE